MVGASEESEGASALYFQKYLCLGGVLGILSDGDDRRIFWGSKFSIPGVFWVEKFGKYFFYYLSRDIFGYLKQSVDSW